MKTVLKLGAICAAILLVMSSSGAAQVVSAPYTENFDGGLPPGWTLVNSSKEGVGWAVDGDPGITKVGNGLGGLGADGPTAGGSAGSLNYNDGINFEEDISKGTNSGDAISPVIDVTALGGQAMITFDLNMETDFYLSQDTSLDHFTVTVTDDFAESYTIDFGDNTSPLGSVYFFNSGPMGTFRRVGFDFALFGFTPGFSTIQIDFSFDTGDATNNAYSGIFVDNLQVCSDLIAPPAPVNVTPADGSTQVGGPGVPVALNWTDVVDTTSCGNGSVWFYVDEVYDAGNVLVYSNSADGPQDTIAAGLPPGTYHWHALAIDGAINVGPFSAFTTFTIEPPLPPLAPDVLYVNDSVSGAQSGSSGFVDPVIDERPHFSAVYRDGNSVDNAIAYRFQVSTDPTFLAVDFDSGPSGIAPILPKDSRCQDLTVNLDLQRDTVYFWRIQFTDAAGATGPFSLAQSFHIGNDFDFGVRLGSTHHGRKCYVATAAFGGVTPEVGRFVEFRKEVIEKAGAGQVFSRAYHTAGATVAGWVPAPAVRAVLGPLSAAAAPWVAAAACFSLMLFAAGRLFAR